MLSLGALRVDIDSTAPAPDGADWSTAYPALQDALDQAAILNTDGDAENDVNQIWIAEGTYKPTALLDSKEARSATFSMLDGVSLYGGFASDEPGLESRHGGETLLTGDILDNGTYGPDFAPDWDDTDLVDLISRHVTEPMGYTWYKPWSTYWPGRLDFIIYTDSNLSIPLSAILQTNFLPTAYRSLYGFAAGDTDDASDHLPHFADLSGMSQGASELPYEAIPGLRMRLSGSNPHAGGRVEIRFELQAATAGPARVSIHDATGRQVRLLATELVLRDGLALAWDGRDGAGRTCVPGAYWVRLATEQGEASSRVVLLD